MIEASQCVICEGAIIQLKRALVVPFLAKRIWNRTPFCVSLVKCETCGFMFYNPRLNTTNCAVCTGVTARKSIRRCATPPVVPEARWIDGLQAAGGSVPVPPARGVSG